MRIEHDDNGRVFITTTPNAWKCPTCPWMETAHPDYGWQPHNDHAVKVHKTQLCPGRH